MYKIVFDIYVICVLFVVFAYATIMFEKLILKNIIFKLVVHLIFIMISIMYIYLCIM